MPLDERLYRPQAIYVSLPQARLQLEAFPGTKAAPGCPQMDVGVKL
jgi:hypothetical protein